MSKGAARGRGGRGAGVRLGILMAVAFLAGLTLVGAALLVPGRGKSAAVFVPPPVTEAPAPAPGKAAFSPESSPLPRLAIVVDDLGYEPTRDAEWLKLPSRITVAVLPFGPCSRNVAESARARGWGVILHVPMEPEAPSPDRTEGFRLRRGMTIDEMDSLLSRMFEDLPQASGASNHMGSAVTADPASMEAYASVLRKKGYFLLDSVTSSRSVAMEAALRAGIPAARRDVFLDAGMTPAEMRGRWDRAVAIAREKGAAILVCPGRTETLKVMMELLSRLEEEKVEAVTLEELLRGKGPGG